MSQITLPLLCTKSQLLDYIALDNTIYPKAFEEFKRVFDMRAAENGEPPYEGSVRDMLEMYSNGAMFVNSRWFQLAPKEDGSESLEEVTGIILDMVEEKSLDKEKPVKTKCCLAFPQQITENGMQLYLVVKGIDAVLLDHPLHVDHRVWLGDYDNAENLLKKINMKYFRFRVVK